MTYYKLYHSLNILVTGFGPFPGVSNNISAKLAEQLVGTSYKRDLKDTRFLKKHKLFHHSFCCEWRVIPQDLRHLIQGVQPHIAIHLGVHQTLQSLALERYAYNMTEKSLDATHIAGAGGRIVPAAPQRLETEFSTQRVLHFLKAEHIPCRISHNPGRYLCNYLYYQSLLHGQRTGLPYLSLFVHLPTQNKPFLYTGLLKILNFATRFYAGYRARTKHIL